MLVRKKPTWDEGKILWPRRASHQSGWHAGECRRCHARLGSGTGEANQVIFTPRNFFWMEPLRKLVVWVDLFPFPRGHFSFSNLLGNSWVYNLGDDQQISFWLHHCIWRVFFLIRHELGMPSCWRPIFGFLMIFVSRNRCHDQLPNHLQVHFVV